VVGVVVGQPDPLQLVEIHDRRDGIDERRARRCRDPRRSAPAARTAARTS
jgi:hypothetical protein